MVVSYNKLWKKLIDLEMSRSELRLKAGLSTRQLAKLGKNENVTTDVLVKICRVLNCNIDKIMDVLEIKEKKKQALGGKNDLVYINACLHCLMGCNRHTL